MDPAGRMARQGHLLIQGISCKVFTIIVCSLIMNNIEIVNIAQKCLRNLREYLGEKVRLEAPKTIEAEFQARLRTPNPFRLHVRVRTQILTKEQVRHLIEVLNFERKKTRDHPLILAAWIDDLWADEFRKAGIFYADVAGNAFLATETPRIMVDVRGRTPEHPPKAEPGRLIEPTGLKVIHWFLRNPKAVEDPYRRIAEDAGVALGTVAVVFRELAAAGYLVRAARDRVRLERWNDLLELFVRGYALKLRPACLLRRYRHREQDVEKLHNNLFTVLDAQQPRIRHALTGGHADRYLTGHLRADTLTLFVEQKALPILATQPMMPDPAAGNLTLLELFAETIIDAGRPNAPPIATPLLVYAELLHDGRPRELETAQMIRERYLAEAHER